MPVALGDFRSAINFPGERIFFENARISPKPHRTAEISLFPALFQSISAQPFGHEANHRIAAFAEFRRSRALDFCYIPRKFDYRHLHPETYAEIGDFVLARDFHGGDFSLRTVLAEPAGNQDSIS